MSVSTQSASSAGLRVKVQKFGTFLSNMVMPNIGAFIAWGFITSLFIEVGWLNQGGKGGLSPSGWVAHIGGWGDYAGGGIVGPMITYLLPLLIGYTGGKMVYGVRGGVVGAIATMGVIAGTDIPMFMGAMIMGPLGGWTMKKIDRIWDGKIKPGFEMLVNNFSAGIWGMILAVFAFFVMSPIVKWVADRLGEGVAFLVNHGLLPLTSIVIEPAKVLFLNNALNHGVLTPLGTQEAAGSAGKSILFLLEANPAAGLGLLLAYTVFGKGAARASAPGAAIIHFFGGIHEIYFPYVLAKPRLILAMIAGGMTQIFVNVLFGSGLHAPAAPGSILAVYSQLGPNSFLGVTLSVILGAAATFIVAALLLKTDKSEDDGDLSSATASMESMKGKKSIASSVLGTTGGAIRNIVFACDAGMGSSAMGASVLRKKIEAAGITGVTVVNKAIANLSGDEDLVITHQDLTTRAEQGSPNAIHVSVDNFMGSPRYDEVVELVKERNGASSPKAESAAPATSGGAAGDVLPNSAIVLNGTATDRDGAITEAGRLLVASGAVDPSYVDAMHEREQSVSTHMGNLLAIPHGTNEAKSAINHTAMSFVRYPSGLDWNGKETQFVVGIAGAGNDHLALLSKLAGIFVDKEQVARLQAATSAQEIQDILSSVSV